MCKNYQEILHLLGFEYDRSSNGVFRDGFGVVDKTVFSVMNNEDFSHDMVHYYCEKIRKTKRNRTAEEGLAYLWGNAYYTDFNGEMISHDALVSDLRQYVRTTGTDDYLALFQNSPEIFGGRANEVSVKSVISGLICNAIEKEKGIAGIKQLINCGKGDDQYFKVIEELLNVNKENFNRYVTGLINSY